MELKLPFGLREGKIVHISEISQNEKGLKCNCICPSCGQKLIARLGNVRIRHFAHAKEECKNAFETALHLFAKEILSIKGFIRLPQLKLRTGDYCHSEKYIGEEKTIIEDGYVLQFDKIDVETKIGNIIPDIVVYKNNVPLLIEIAVTHFVDKNKREKIVKKGLSAIETNLNMKDIDFYNFDKEDIEYAVVESTKNKSWIFNRKKNIRINQLRQEEVVRRKEMAEEEVIMSKEVAESDVKPLEPKKRTVAAIYNKLGTCSECGEKTHDWIVYDGKNKTCICRKCW